MRQRRAETFRFLMTAIGSWCAFSLKFIFCLKRFEITTVVQWQGDPIFQMTCAGTSVANCTHHLSLDPPYNNPTTPPSETTLTSSHSLTSGPLVHADPQSPDVICTHMISGPILYHLVQCFTL